MSTNQEASWLEGEEYHKAYDRIIGPFCVALALIEDNAIELRNANIDPNKGYDHEAWRSVAYGYPTSQGIKPFDLKIVWNIVHVVDHPTAKEITASLTSTGE